MNAREALRFVESHGVVLVAARGPVPRLTEAIVDEPVTGSWWGHPKAHEIYAVLEVVTSSSDVLVCRAVSGKVTLVHRRLWPALICVADQLGRDRLAKVVQVHTEAGHHVNHEVAFPDWADDASLQLAGSMTAADAHEQLGGWSTKGR